MTTITIHEKIGLAQRFAAQLSEALTVHQMQLVNKRNGEEGPHSQVCHSHDFCDANVYMGEAWSDMFGSEFPMADEATDADMEVWNDAWYIAKAAEFWA